MESPRNRQTVLSLVPALEHPKVDVEVEDAVELAPEPVRLTGRAAERAERANLLALGAAIDEAHSGG